MGQYHPHGDTAIYDTLVRLSQPWVMRDPLVGGQGNFGSPGNDPAAAMRYTECKMAPLAMEMVRDIDEDTVDFRPNYDGRSSEPVLLPARFPNLLVNGSAGIAVGMATNIPPHNLREVADGVQWSLEQSRRHPRGAARGAARAGQGAGLPDRCADRRSARDRARPTAPAVARSSMRAVVDVEEDAKGRTCLVITQLPYQVNPDNLALKIAELADSGKVQGIADVRDDSSSRTGQRLVVVLKRDAIARVVLNNLYKHTQLQDNFGCNMLGAGRRRAAHADPRPVRHALDQPPDRRDPAAHPLPAAQGRGGGAHLPRSGEGAGRARRGDRADPGQPDGRGRAQRTDRAARHRRGAGPRHPRHAAAQAGGAGAAGDHRSAAASSSGSSPTSRTSSPTSRGSARSSARSSRRSSTSTATSAARRSSRPTATCRWRT